MTAKELKVRKKQLILAYRKKLLIDALEVAQTPGAISREEVDLRQLKVELSEINLQLAQMEEEC